MRLTDDCSDTNTKKHNIGYTEGVLPRVKNGIIPVILFLSFVLFFSTVAYNHLSVNLWDYDFWWHLATGRYIVENGALPEQDPFSYVSNLKENEYRYPVRAQFILKQYWLAQVLFYKVHSLFGDAGIIVLRSLTLLAASLLVLFWLRREGVRFFISFPLVFAVFNATMRYSGERPVLFTILFAIITFMILEEHKRNRGRIAFWLIPMIVLWAQLHGGFILGAVIIATYIVGEGINLLLSRGSEIFEGEMKGFKTLCLAGGAAIALSGINPNGYTGFLAATSMSSHFEQGVQEYYPPFFLYYHKLQSIEWSYVGLLVLSAVVVMVRRSRFGLVYYLLLSGMTYMSLTAQRYVIFYICIASMILGRELFNILSPKLDRVVNTFRWEALAAFAVCCSVLLYAYGSFTTEKIWFSRATNYSVPAGAVDFIRKNRIEGNIFNDMGSGGYIAWELFPWKKSFIDSRSLNYIVNMEYGWIMRAQDSAPGFQAPAGAPPLWERLLNHYDIDIILTNTTGPFGEVAQLYFRLMEHPEWVPVYADLVSIVFVRDVEENKKLIEQFAMPKEVVNEGLVVRLTKLALSSREKPQVLMSLGDVFFYMGRYEDALKAYEHAAELKKDPHISLLIDITRKKLAEEEANAASGQSSACKSGEMASGGLFALVPALGTPPALTAYKPISHDRACPRNPFS